MHSIFSLFAPRLRPGTAGVGDIRFGEAVAENVWTHDTKLCVRMARQPVHLGTTPLLGTIWLMRNTEALSSGPK